MSPTQSDIYIYHISLHFENNTITECIMKDWSCESLVLVVNAFSLTVHDASLAHTLAGQWMKMLWLKNLEAQVALRAEQL